MIEANRFALDGGAMFGGVPRTIWEQRLRPDAQHRIPLTTRCLLFRRGGELVLVDTGIGDRWEDKGRERYAIGAPEGGLRANLAAAGVAPGDITLVIATHLHFDHIGGLLERGPDGAARPAFPRSRVLVQRRAWEWAQQPSAQDRGSFRREDFAWLEGDDRLELVDGEQEVLPGVSLVPTEGHSPGMQLVRVAGAERWLIFAADLAPTRHHLRVPWHMAYDLQPLTCMAEKRRIFGQAADEGAWVALEHDPEAAVVTVRRRNGDLEAGEVIV